MGGWKEEQNRKEEEKRKTMKGEKIWREEEHGKGTGGRKKGIVPAGRMRGGGTEGRKKGGMGNGSEETKQESNWKEEGKEKGNEGRSIRGKELNGAAKEESN